MSFSISISQILLFIWLWFALTSATCYFPNGALPQQDSPCLPDQVEAGRASFCCGPGYACLSNRLCKATALSGNINFTRGSCTDKTWNSPDCPNFCLDVPSGGVGVNQCNSPFSTRFCCSEDLNTCNCSRSDGGALDFFTDYSVITTIGYSPSTSSKPTTVTLPTTTTSSYIATTLSSTSVSTSSSSQSGSTSSTMQSTTVTGAGAGSASSNPQSSESSTVPIAVGVAVPCGTILLALAFLLMYRYHRKKLQTSAENRQAVHSAIPMQSDPYKDNPQDYSGYQRQSNPAPQEMGRHSPILPELANHAMSPRELRGNWADQALR